MNWCLDLLAAPERTDVLVTAIGHDGEPRTELGWHTQQIWRLTGESWPITVTAWQPLPKPHD